MSKNKVCHVEIEVSDLEKAQAFYGSIFDWKFQPFGEMVVFGTGTEHIGGFMKVENRVHGTSPSIWIECEEIEVITAKVPVGGGEVLSPKTDLPGVGWSASIRDPDGNQIGLVQFSRK